MLGPVRPVDGSGRTDPAADGRSASIVYDQQEPWHSNPEVQLNEFAKPRSKNHLHRSHSAIPTSRNNDLALNGDPRLSRSRNSIRSLKRQAPRPPGPPPKSLLSGINPEGLALLTHQNISAVEGGEVSTDSPTSRVTPSAPSITPPPNQFRSPSSNSDVDADVMVPYKRHHMRSPQHSPMTSKPRDPRALSLLALDDSYSQPHEHPLLTRNYSGKRSRPESVITNVSSADDNCKQSILPDSAANSPDGEAWVNNSTLPPTTDDKVSSDDDMTIMRPGRQKQQPFDGYKQSSGGIR